MVEHLFPICCEVRGIPNNCISFHLQPYVSLVPASHCLVGERQPCVPPNCAGFEVQAIQSIRIHHKDLRCSPALAACVPKSVHPFLLWQCFFKKNTHMYHAHMRWEVITGRDPGERITEATV